VSLQVSRSVIASIEALSHAVNHYPSVILYIISVLGCSGAEHAPLPLFLLANRPRPASGSRPREGEIQRGRPSRYAANRQKIQNKAGKAKLAPPGRGPFSNSPPHGGEDWTQDCSYGKFGQAAGFTLM